MSASTITMLAIKITAIITTRHKSWLILGLLLSLQACESTREESGKPISNEDSNKAHVLIVGEAQVTPSWLQGNNNPERLVADYLYEALQALADDRLLTPLDDNAHTRFLRVLSYQSDNKIALQGLQDIVLRYLQLSTQASRRGMFEQAEAFIERAKFVDSGHTGIAQAQTLLLSERDSGDLFFELDEAGLAEKSLSVQAQLAHIAQQAKTHNALFLITAPNDEQARWMYAIMREAVSGYRLRGNIERSSSARVRLKIPATDNSSNGNSSNVEINTPVAAPQAN
ncbi:MAG: hypothetical protein COC19_00270 [SAR86 cluster bacterium]|uniref:Uncharacterized protein n=1 Tax=SAR86 cluster bacterium TaxID=2030880 RepID=A0A2A4MVZ4_9GAMM|nr:MAG: hypothetical protein COC19_00270 [SAR86 cluster bacterium]